MPAENKPDNTARQQSFTSFPSDISAEVVYPTRDAENKKLDVTDLFTHFTASIIQEDATFIR